jgi:hypothetical protein
MRRPFTVALLGLFVALGSSSLLHAQQVKPISYEDLVSRLETVESELTAMQDAAPIPDQVYSDNSCVRGGLFVEYENVWIKPYFDHNTAYQIFDAIPNIPEAVRIVEFDWGFRSTPRIELGYIVPGSGLGWRARYWQFDSSTSARAADPFVANGSPGRIEVGLHDDPDIEVSTGNNEAVQATDALSIDVVDLEGMIRRESDCSQLTFSGGLRYLRKDQNYRADFVDVTTGVVDDILVSDTFFEGVGPTLAMEGVRRLGSSSLSVFGKARGSLLLGDSGLQQARIDPQTPAAPIRDFVTTENSLDFQFIAELQVGLQYERCFWNGKTLFGRIGAEVQYWPSGGSASYQNGEDSDGSGADPRDADMLLFGLSASVGTKW